MRLAFFFYSQLQIIHRHAFFIHQTAHFSALRPTHGCWNCSTASRTPSHRQRTTARKCTGPKSLLIPPSRCRRSDLCPSPYPLLSTSGFCFSLPSVCSSTLALMLRLSTSQCVLFFALPSCKRRHRLPTSLLKGLLLAQLFLWAVDLWAELWSCMLKTTRELGL